MNRIRKNEIYDEMCHLLTDYENNEGVCETDLYAMLVRIQNNWEELTDEDE